MSNIGKWSATASFDASGYVNGVAKMESASRTAGQKVGAGFKGMEQAVDGALGGVGASMSAFGMRIGFQSLTIAGALNTVRQTWNSLFETMGQEIELGHLNDRLGTSIEWLSAFGNVASENGIQFQQFAMILNRFNAIVGEARTNGGAAAETFGRLGVNLNQPFEAVFTRTAEALSRISDRAARAREAVRLFGEEGGARMMRNLDNFAARISEMQGRGGFTTEEDQERFVEMEASVNRMTTAWSQLWREFTSTTAPVVTAVLNGWSAILFHQEPVWQNVVRDTDMAVLESLARQFRESGNNWFLRLDADGPIGHLIENGLRVPVELTVGGLGQTLDANAILAQITGGAAPAATAGGGWWGDVMSGFRELATTTNNLMEEFRAAERDAARIAQSVMSPLESFQQQQQQINRLQGGGLLNADQGNLASLQAFEQLERTLGTLEVRLPEAMEQGSSAALSLLNQARTQRGGDIQERIREVLDAALTVQRETRDEAAEMRRVMEQIRDEGGEVADILD